MGPQGCNWFWGSHGCDLHSGHTGYHLCGSLEEDPCSKHDGTRVLFHYVGGDWADEWREMPGFCNGDGTPRLVGSGNYPPCPEPEHCLGRDTPGHRGW